MRLPYEPDDDRAAEELINIELRNPVIARWRAMTSDHYVIQTDRVLLRIYRRTEATYITRNARMADMRAAFVANEITAEQRRDAIAQHEAWKATVEVFRAEVEQRREQIIHRVRTLTGDNGFTIARTSLHALARAVAEHRATVDTEYEPTKADRLLWSRLSIVTYPLDRHGEHTATLDEYLRHEERKQRGQHA
ncbi:hypothetical protein [Actinokineospora iranica]|uniref:Uncharacterized protein n=1 Tax=Actinokineospora iranica TaxID=1271860 RepID=A0A1G6P6P7_9PSEU|nr:hypothetical protein [Actinokineospora iranica]SDC75930.1 hypothetical protein SAMN05216174_104149 [Actinokineospora iranica]